ncbi:MAG: DUF4293 domain-containing protein [Clostridium sp.]|nr:DUF4293 domain-containing protein [Clostridium sp.]
MVIQRIQSLLLLIAAALTVAFLFVAYGYTSILEDGVEVLTPLYAREFLPLLIPACIATLLLLVDIFLFKNMDLQKNVARIAIVAILATIGVTVYILASGFHDVTDGAVVESTVWGGGGLLLVGSLVATIAAISRISTDQRLLRSIDRLR